MTALLEVGRISKAHGIRGEVVVHLTTDRTERLDPGSVLSTDHGDLAVVASRPHQQSWIVAFDGVVTRNQAEELRGRVLRAEPLEDEGVDWVHELIGATVLDTDGGVIGTVRAVEDNPAADLLVLDSGALIPMTFVVGSEPGRVTVDLPEGLLDL